MTRVLPIVTGVAGFIAGSLVVAGAQTAQPTQSDADAALATLRAYVASHPDPTPTTTAGTTTTAAPAPTTTVAPAPNGVGCGLSSAAFCETFDQPSPGSTARGGDLPFYWGVSRVSSDVNMDQGADNAWTISHINGCGPTTANQSPNDLRICGGRLYEATNDGDMVTAFAMYPKQPFDFAGRTGTVTFDVSDDSGGSHAAWPEFWITDKPYPAPQPTATAGQQNNIANGVGFRMTENVCQGDPGKRGLDAFWVIRNYVQQEFPVQDRGCVTLSRAADPAINHFEVRVSQNRVELLGTDPGSTRLISLGHADGVNLSLTRGLVWIEDVHYTAEKCVCGQTEHTFAWDNVGFDGPKTYRDFSFDVPDRLVPGGHPNGINLGYPVQGDITPPVIPRLTVQGVHSDQTPTGALVTFNWWGDRAPQVPDVRVNGGPWHSTAWPFVELPGTWKTIAVPVPSAETQAGTNTIELRMPGSRAVVSNVNLILVAAGRVP
jgi:hypothetical protein